jgi:Domain of unknown function (DUF4389)
VSTSAASSASPVRVEGDLDSSLNRWLPLVKWFLAIPHFIVLGLLWVGFIAVSVVAFFAILFTGRYPRALFDFNLGVLRWTWRVGFYSYSALATDRYPAFSLADDASYPARLDVAYPEELSRGLVLVKWWLLAIPHYVIVGVFAGAAWGEWTGTRGWSLAASGGLIGVLVCFAGVALLFTERYPRSIYEFLMGMNRWVWRVVAYAALMTDEYPPFRLDMGPREPEPAPPPAREKVLA